MIEFRTLGSVNLKGPDGGEIRAVLTRPKRVALLAYLAVATPRGFHRRDVLLALFWPEHDQQHARASLRKALHTLRRAVGEDVLLGRGDEELGVADGRLWCDAVAFERALDEKALAEALELYRGDFLEGFFISGGAEFERWLERERARLRDRAAAAAWTLADEAADTGSPTTAAYWARRAAGPVRYDEGALQRLMTVLYRAGDRAGALRAYEQFAEQLKAEYAANPSAETRALFEGIRDTGGHAARPWRPMVRPPPPAPLAPQPAPAISRTSLVGMLAGLVLLLALASAWAIWRIGVQSPPGTVAQVLFAEQLPAIVPGNRPVSPPVRITIRDAVGHSVPGPVTLALGDAPWPGATLSGALTVDAARGLASFGNLRIDKPGVGYTLLAASGAARGQSAPFRVGVWFGSVGAFYRHSCGVTISNDMYCWGSNGHGQLGGAAGELDSVPALVGGGIHFTQVTGGGDHVCGLVSGGTVYCWGRNDAGQLGNNTTTPSGVPVRVHGSGEVELVFRSISSGAHHTCGIATGNLMYCWGSDSWGNKVGGQLGDGLTTNAAMPVAVLGPGGGVALTFAAVAAGGDHTCGITLTGNRLYCWGRNDHGQLGDNSTTLRRTPVMVSGPNARVAVAFVTVSGGLRHTCGVTNQSVAYCWGSNDRGQLGDNTTMDRHMPTPVAGPDGGPPLVVAAISAGGSHTCAVATTGSLYCWGFNGDGELGDGTRGERHAPVLVAGSQSIRWAQASAGDRHTCGRRSDGGDNLVYCWGNNELGQLGDGTRHERLQPVPAVQ